MNLMKNIFKNKFDAKIYIYNLLMTSYISDITFNDKIDDWKWIVDFY